MMANHKGGDGCTGHCMLREVGRPGGQQASFAAYGAILAALDDA